MRQRDTCARSQALDVPVAQDQQRLTSWPGSLPLLYWAKRLTDLATIDLDSLLAEGSLLTRVDRKYLLPLAAVPNLMARLPAETLALEIDANRTFGYSSLYFDTPGLNSYLMAARRRPRRFKVRTRTYLDTGQCWLEAKTRDGRGRSVKFRIPHDPTLRDRLSADARHFLAGPLAGVGPDPSGLITTLAPELATDYQRATLFLPSQGARVTIDVDVRAMPVPDGPQLRIARHLIVETKSPACASSVDRLLWRLGHRPIRFSKYATSMAALHPVLPANRWRPALRRLAAS